MRNLSVTARTAKCLQNLILQNILKEEKTPLAVEVYRWSDGSYLEDQDFWRLSGIQRTVFLHARPKTFISDFFAVGDLENNYNDGLLKVDVALKSAVANDDDFVVDASLYDGYTKVVHRIKGCQII